MVNIVRQPPFAASTTRTGACRRSRYANVLVLQQRFKLDCGLPMKCAAFAIGSVISIGTLSAAAEPTANDKVTAEALFGDGRKLMAAGNFRQACPKFEASLRLDPGVGTMLNLADCYEKNQQTASAWAQFREASSAARAAGSKEREDLARQRAAALEPKLSRLTITVGTQTVRVTRDGAPVDPAALGSAMPIDPGRHVIEATAPGKQKASKTVDVPAGSARVSVEIPILADDTSARATSGGSNAGAAGGNATGSTPGDASVTGSSSQRTIAIAVGAVGIVGIGAGTYFGLKASSDWNGAKTQCLHFPAGCSDSGIEQGDNAKSSATLATVGFAVGVVGLAGAVVLWVTAPKTPNAGTQVGLVGLPGGIAVRGAF